MKTREPADLFLYRHRYFIGYGFLVTIFALYLVIASLLLPGGLTQGEIDMVGITDRLDFSDLSSLAVANLPLHLLQAAIFSVFGVSILTIKLPAIILAIASAVAIFFLLRRWFKPSVSILSLILIVSSGQFSFAAQSFTPQILYILYSLLILLFASLIFQKVRWGKIWKICLSIAIGLSLFTPYFWFINLGLITVAIAHPHTRHFILRRKYLHQWIPATLIFCVLAMPILYFTFISHDFLMEIIGLSNLQLSITENIKVLLTSYLLPDLTTINGQITPLMDFGVLIIILFGFIQTLRNCQSARSYMIIAWSALALPLLVIDPSLNPIMTVPAFVLLAVGMETLLREWYKLFPKNPYARGTGLAMIIAMISTMTLTSLDTFINSYRHLPEAVYQYNTDLILLAKHKAGNDVVLTVDEDERPIYATLIKYNNLGMVISDKPQAESTQIIVSHQAKSNFVIPTNARLSRIINNGRREQADRFYVYDISTK